ncbi:MAG: hypothetical protein PHI96_07125 [Desulfovibrio sp.]|nr:hypothetical protein [Desulfovibrio sp.]
MRKVFFGVFAAILAVVIYCPAWAGPEDSLRKLTAGMWAFQAQNKEGLPPCPLTEDEARELSAFMVSEYQKQGQELFPEQAGMMAGLLAGYAAATDGPKKMGNNRQKTGAVPAFDIEAYCKDIAQGSHVIESGCTEGEHEAKNAIASMTDVPENTLRHCTEVAQTGRGSYTVMRSCIETERNAKKQLGQ